MCTKLVAVSLVAAVGVRAWIGRERILGNAFHKPVVEEWGVICPRQRGASD
jgi:hypothetical protein